MPTRTVVPHEGYNGIVFAYIQVPVNSKLLLLEHCRKLQLQKIIHCAVPIENTGNSVVSFSFTKKVNMKHNRIVRFY